MDTPYPIAFTFHAMAASGNASGLKTMLKQAGSDNVADIINHRDHRGFTVLHRAMESGKRDLVQILLELGADITAEVVGPDPKGWTALHLAAFDGHADIIKLLVNRGADLNHLGAGPTKMTPLRVAVTRNYPECVRTLLSLGADPLEKDLNGFTLLHEATNIGNRDMVEQLLSAGCDPLSKAKDGSTPFIWATQHGDKDLVILLGHNS